MERERKIERAKNKASERAGKKNEGRLGLFRDRISRLISIWIIQLHFFTKVSFEIELVQVNIT